MTAHERRNKRLREHVLRQAEKARKTTLDALGQLTRADLIEIANNRGIETNTRTTKAELLELLNEQ